MVEFASRPQKRKNPLTLIISAVLFALILGGIFAYMQWKGESSRQQGEPVVTVPGLLRAGNTDFEYYRTKILIEEVKAVLQISFSKVRTAKISGTIVNDGDRELEALELHISLFDVWGKASKERSAFILRPGAGYSGRPMKPLERRPFSTGVEAVDYYWDPEQISYEITGLKYR